MTNLTNQNRRPAGSPAATGGQFASAVASESTVDLTSDAAQGVVNLTGDISQHYTEPRPGATPASSEQPWGMRTRKWAPSDWVPDVDGYQTDDGFTAKPCYVSGNSGSTARKVGWTVSGPGRDIPVHVDTQNDAHRWMKTLQDSHYRDLEAQKWPATGPARFSSTSTTRRDASRKLVHGIEAVRREMREARSHLTAFKRGDRVITTDDQGYAREGTVTRGSRSDGQFGSWESYALHIDHGNTTTKIDSYVLANASKGIRHVEDSPPPLES